MNIKAKTFYGQKLIIIAFVTHYDKICAVTVDYKGNLDYYDLNDLTISDEAVLDNFK